MKHFRVTIRRHAELTTQEDVEAESPQEAADFVRDMIIDTGELGSVESWIEELPRDWQVEDYKDTVVLVEELQ